MARLVVTHGVGNMETWLAKGAEREKVFAQFSSSHRVYRLQGADRVAIVSEDVDLAKMAALMPTPEMQATMKAHTVLEPLEMYVEIPDAK